MNERRALWVSTSPETRGGIASVVRAMRSTPLWERWSIRHVTTHRDGSAAVRAAVFTTGAARFVVAVVRERPSVVHLHTASYGSFARKATLAALCRILRIPVVLHVHGAEFHRFHERSPRILRAMIRSTLTHAAAVVALGEVWARRLAAIAPAARITVIPNAVVVGDRIAQPRDGEPVCVLFLGRIGDRKGAFVLLDAWAKVCAAVGDPGGTRLLLAGDGEVDRARARIADLGVQDSVAVLGWIPPERVPELIGSAHVLVLPSRDEGQPMAVLEAMARGLCVVTTMVGGLPDLVDRNCAAIVPADAPDPLARVLLQLVADPGLRVRLGRNAHARALIEFDVDVAWRRIDALYEQVMQ